MNDILFQNKKKMKIEDFVIDPNDKEGVLLGKGSFATVYRAVHRLDKKKYAIKVVR